MLTAARAADWRPVLASVPAHTGIILLGVSARERRAIERAARRRSVVAISEARGRILRVHDQRELTRALASGADVLVSALFATASHPGRPPLPRQRAATLARLAKAAGARVIALGGMDAKRFAAVRRLGFDGWAGIGAFDTPRTAKAARIRT